MKKLSKTDRIGGGNKNKKVGQKSTQKVRIMNNSLVMLEKIIPEGIESFKVRYTLMQIIAEEGPIGRRGLATQTTYSERTIRTSIELLSKQGLIDVAHKGMIVTDEGTAVMNALYFPFYETQKCSELEKNLQVKLEAKRVIIVSGDSTHDEDVMRQIGKAAAHLVTGLIEDHDTIAITGGSTIAQVIESLEPKIKKNVTVIPARGNIGKRVELQATTLAATLANKLAGKYEALSVPDNLNKASIDTIKQDPHIEKTLQKMAESDMIMLGLGNALQMAEQRHETQEVMCLLKEKQAVAEVFRYYFNQSGEVVYSTESIGINLEVAMQIPKKVIVAGGRAKASPLLAIKALIKGSYLVIDEGMASEILSSLNEVSTC